MSSVIFVIFWFVVIVLAFFVFIVRPQRRRIAAHQALVDRVAVGDQIITTGGLIGEIESVEPATLRLRIADDVVVHVARGAIAQLIPDAESADANLTRKAEEAAPTDERSVESEA